MTTGPRPGLAAVVLDVDGTLVDSERDGHRVAFNQAFAEAGLPDRWDPETYGRLLDVTGGRRRLTRYLLAGGRGAQEAAALAASLHQRKTGLMRDLVAAGAVPARPGAARLLADLAAAGVELHVATTGSRVWVEPLLDHCFAGARFVSIVTGTEVATLKPDPAVYLEVLRRSGHHADSVVAVEDSAAGVAAAVGAGLRCLAVTNDYTLDHDLSAATYVGTGLDDPGVVEWFRRRTRPPAISATSGSGRPRSTGPSHPRG